MATVKKEDGEGPVALRTRRMSSHEAYRLSGRDAEHHKHTEPKDRRGWEEASCDCPNHRARLSRCKIECQQRVKVLERCAGREQERCELFGAGAGSGFFSAAQRPLFVWKGLAVLGGAWRSLALVSTCSELDSERAVCVPCQPSKLRLLRTYGSNPIQPVKPPPPFRFHLCNPPWPYFVSPSSDR